MLTQSPFCFFKGMDLPGWNWWIKWEKRIHCFLKGGGPICRIIWQGTSIDPGKIGRASFCPALESKPPRPSFSGLAGRGRWWRLFKQLLHASMFSCSSARGQPDPRALGEFSPESQCLPPWPRCDTDFPVSLCWFTNRSLHFCFYFCLPVIVFQ